MRNKLQKAGLIMTGVFAGVLISLNFPASADKVSAAPLPVEELRAFADVFNAIKQGYVEPVEDKKLINHAISGMLSGLDPHSAYLDVEAYKELQVGTHGEFGGLGIEVGMEDGFVKVISPIEDTPAFRSGVKAGDLIVKLDETPVKGMTLSDAVKRMRGKPKTDITLTIVRKGEDRPVVVTLTREVIKVQSVKSKMVEPGYGYLRVAQFQENTSQAVAEHLAKLAKEGDMKGLVLDLRNDPGGLLHGAVGVASAFLPANALVVSTDGRTDDAKREYRARADDYLRGSREDFLKDLPAGARTLPMVVLVNAGSASASEIVAGALQDHRRAVVMGTQTFGKGSVQTILPLNSNTAIKLTTARYYTPSGRSIQAKGIEPDIIVEETANGSSRRLREADLERHLGNDRDPEAEPKKADEPKAGDQSPADDEAEALPRPELASKDDYQLNQAINLLKGLQIVQNKKE
ncbi:S41 family peptidase [Aromatoleum aromaticum]|uniref:Carboxy-terminal processing protease n=1 Tax=Aromatoleum aromaticum (strain DSM 19018 / LMG 30748 / EbN1) TaxID=76114 RepID=Q5P7N6_AROAE|nr:S41 family peptidase [Aromatoleum aromaticum]NMG53119.1 PDZ domain-containing protein [Aromatoleum aromaticum]CAI06675.1 Carboxy-terminal processing protease [Aromatoleum aromaticum EbN1]